MNPSREKRILISCVFGTHFRNLYRSVAGETCVLFSNNAALRDEAIAKGWVFELVKGHPLCSDYRVSSMQAKYIKYLCFLAEFPAYEAFGTVVYFDHKFNVEKRHLDWIDKTMREDRSVLIRNTPRLKTSLHDEIEDALGQERYAVSMPQTIAWIRRGLSAARFSCRNRIMNTGIIVYRHVPRILPLLSETYATVWLLAQPECQIIWACLSQEYEREIQRVEWADLNPEWRAPDEGGSSGRSLV